MDEKELTLERLRDLANQSFNNNKFTFSTFLSAGELSDFYSIEKELNYANPFVWGGAENTERAMVRFGDPESLGYTEDFPIVMLEVSPLNMKFSDDFSHRDFLGSLMNLGVERNTLGDILIKDNRGYVFCRDSVAEYICDNLTRVRHTTVKVSISDTAQEVFKPNLEEKTIQTASERADAVISKVYNLSRNTSNELFRAGKVFVNNRECTENARLLKENDILSVRGFGKLIYKGVAGTSKKGKLNLTVEIYR